MKITLIKPSLNHLNTGYNLNEGSMEPLQMALIAGLCDSEELRFYDDRLEAIPFEEATDMVVITADTFSALRAYTIAAGYRSRQVKVVLGGVHVTLLPEEAALHADCIVTGDAEPVWRQLIDDFKKGALKKHYHGSSIVPQMHCFPDRSIFKGKKYLPVSLIQFSRGCRFNCTFCSVSKFFGSTLSFRKMEDVLYEIEKDKLKTLLFVDDNMVAGKNELKVFLKELIPLHVHWASQSGVDMVQDREMLRLMSDSGCVGNLIGFESINVNSLEWFNKTPNLKKFNNYKEVLEVLRDYGFLTWGSFMIGNDFDTPDTITRTVEFAIKNKLTLAFFHILMPYPGTAVYEQFSKEGRLLYGGAWWTHNDYRYNHAAFVPRLMSPEVLTEATIKANRDFYTWQSIARRLFDTRTHLRHLVNLSVYARFNYVMRRTSI